MASGTKIRRLTRLLDDGDAPLWAIGPDGCLVYLSAACSHWLGVDIESLIDRRSVAGSPISEDPLDRIAAALSPPPGTSLRGTSSLKVQPPAIDEHRPEALEVRYVRIGGDANAITIGVGGSFDDRTIDPELQDAVALRQRLDIWRKRNANLAAIATAGSSATARRMRRRIRVAGSTRTDVGFFGPAGCGSEAIALRVHHLSACGEPIVVVDGPLMDTELLDATIAPVLHQLTDSNESTATTLIRGLDEMPLEAQQRVATLVETFDGRLRVLALCGPRPRLLDEENEKDDGAAVLEMHEDFPSGICAELLELLSSFAISCPPLRQRVVDIPLIATAMVDARHAAGEGSAERISRAALDALVSYPWPRNHDELDESMRHAVRTAHGTSIGPEHLPLEIRSYRTGEPTPKRSTVPLDLAVRRYERRLIQDALDASDGNRAEAARRLDISRARLLRKIEEVSERDQGSNDEPHDD